MERLGGWLVGMTAAAILTAVTETLTPEGTGRKIVGLAAGSLLILTLIRPLAALRAEDMAQALMGSWYVEREIDMETLEGMNTDILQRLIADRAAAYIEGKAAALGITCRAEVTCAVKDGSLPYPIHVRIIGAMDDTQQAALTRTVEADLAVPAQAQSYERGQEG